MQRIADCLTVYRRFGGLRRGRWQVTETARLQMLGCWTERALTAQTSRLRACRAHLFIEQLTHQHLYRDLRLAGLSLRYNLSSNLHACAVSDTCTVCLA